MSRVEHPTKKHIWEIKDDEFTPDGWYHSDETEDLHGPFKTVEQAERELELYCMWLDKGPIAEVLSIPCDLAYTVAMKAKEDVERITGKPATTLYVSKIDDVLAHNLVKEEGLIGLEVQVVQGFSDDTWAIGNAQHFGVGSVGA